MSEPTGAGDATVTGADRREPAEEVRAAGGVVWRVGRDGPEIVIIHRIRYGDWTLPKGKLEAGESWEEAAVREVHEESGVTADLGPELPSTWYTDKHGRPKRVRYWAMTVREARPRPPDHEVDEVRWVPVATAMELLTYEHDRAVVAELDAS